jgi:alpha-ketoglutarate-dependent taurine dioxygenase
MTEPRRGAAGPVAAGPRPVIGRRSAIRPGGGDLVTVSTVGNGRLAIQLVQPTVPGIALGAWAAANGAMIQRLLDEHGGIMFRGFAPGTAARLPEIAEALVGEPLTYVYRSTPRTEVGGRVFTSTEYPADQTIPMHCENAYQSTWPLRLAFACVIRSEAGGETTVADMRAVTARLPRDLIDRFAERDVLYVRNYGGGLDLPWPTVFQTEDRAEVEAYCRDHGIGFEWRGGDRLRTWQRRPALARHPRTGEPFWFNQAHLFHVSALPEEVREGLLASCAEEDLPRDTRFGDGAPIPPEDLATIRAAFEAETWAPPWREDDVMLLDNMRVAHGRNPFTGKRRVLVAMGQPVNG